MDISTINMECKCKKNLKTKQCVSSEAVFTLDVTKSNLIVHVKKGYRYYRMSLNEQYILGLSIYQSHAFFLIANLNTPL